MLTLDRILQSAGLSRRGAAADVSRARQRHHRLAAADSGAAGLGVLRRVAFSAWLWR